MVSAVLSGILGSGVTYWVGTRYFAFGAWDVLWAVLASNVAGFISLLLTLALERRPAIRKVLMGNAPKTWAVLGVLYTGLMLGLDPGLWSPIVAVSLWAPLVWATGFMLPLWGRAQDALIRWEYHRAKRPAFEPRKRRFAASKRNVIRVES
jgi:hypothetical protein